VVEVEALFGMLPKPPAFIDAEALHGLRLPDGTKPCTEGIGAALRWIGNRRLPFQEALAEARGDPRVKQYVAWGLEATGSGDGSGSGSGYGDGDGYGDGYGDGSGYGDGDGYGYGYGYGSSSESDDSEDEDEEDEDESDE
jgi:hypothetical protein